MVNNKYILVILGMLTLFSCDDDMGNYNYSDINEVSLSNFESGRLYEKVAYVDRLDFDPQIVSTQNKNDDGSYEYQWKLIPQGKDFREIEDTTALTISRERKLDQLVTMKPGLYSGFFIVTDKDSGVSWTTPFQLRVRSITSEGWMILCDDNGKSRMDIIFNSTETEDLIAHDIWKENSFNPGKPSHLIFNYRYNVGGAAFMLVTDKNTYLLDVIDLHAGEDNEIKWQFGASPEKVLVKAAGMSQYAIDNNWTLIDQNDDIYMMSLNTYGSLFEFPINKIDGKEPFKPSPFVGVSYDSGYDTGYGCAPTMLYDATHRQFLVIRNNASYPSVMTFEKDKLFSAQTGRDMVYLENTKPGTIFSLLKDPNNGDVYFYGIRMRAEYTEGAYWWEEGTYTEYNTQEYYGKVQGEGIDKATKYAIHHLYPYIFYVYNNTVYQFDMGHPNEAAKPILSFPGEEIVVLKVNPFVAWEAYSTWERQRGNHLVIGTIDKSKGDSECGIMRAYDVPNLMEPLTMVKEYRGLGKIVDIAYKERSVTR